MKRRTNRPRYVAAGDKRSPMQRLLEIVSPNCFVEYAQQWPTFNKAVRLGYIDENGNITTKGKKFLEQLAK